MSGRLVVPKEELNYYNGILPDGDPYKVAVCDVAWGGGDSLSMPLLISLEATFTSMMLFSTKETRLLLNRWL